MDIFPLIEFVHNLALLLTLGLLYDIIVSNKLGKDKPVSKIITGLIISLMGIIIMSTHWEYSPGFFFDPRSVLVGITALFFGNIATLIAVINLSLFRVYQGGGGVLPGILWVIIPAVSGLIWNKIRLKKEKIYRFGDLFIFGIITHVLVLLSLFVLPSEIAIKLIKTVSLPTLLTFPIGTALLGLVLLGRQVRRKTEIQVTRLASVIEQLNEKVIITDLDGHPQFLNHFFETSTGYSLSDVMGESLGTFKSGLNDDNLYEDLWSTIKKGETWHGQIINRRKDGSLYHDEATIFPIFNDEGDIINYASFQRDISEQIKMQETMLQNEKMLSVGRLAAGMAHEINNPLAGMIQSAEVLANRLGQKLDSPINRNEAEKAGITIESITAFMEARDIFRMLNSIKKAGKKVSGIVENMIDFSQKGQTEKKWFQLEDLLEKTLEMESNDFDLIEHYAFKNIKVIKKYEIIVPDVFCIGSKIQQALLNILRNSAQAMQNAQISEPEIILRIKHHSASHMLHLEIEDNGPGMSKDIQNHIFEPFYSTKSVGSGTGLGLSVAYFIIHEEHNGYISVESAPDEGTRFIIGLPL